MKDYYHILELEFPSTQKEIKSAYRRLSMEYHPDRGGSEELMKELNEAYLVLGDPVNKANYDRKYKAAFCRKESSYSSARASETQSKRASEPEPEKEPEPEAHAEEKPSKVNLRETLKRWMAGVPRWAYVAASIALVVTLMGFKAVESIENISLRATSERTMAQTEEGMLEGLYTVRSIGGDGVTYSTAELQMVGHNGCIITVLSDYEPLELQGTISGGSRLNCDLLGEGLVSYKPSTGTIVIRFDNTDIDKICEFSK